MKRLIVNADDFGLCPGIDEGIVELAARGIVTSVSVLADLVRPAAIAELLSRASAVGIGLHVDFTHDLVHYDPNDLSGRLERQLERFATLVGRAPDHLDSHKHAHCDHRAACAAMLAVGVPLRATKCRARRLVRSRGLACPDHFAGSAGVRPALSRVGLEALLRNLDSGTTELMCHPAVRWDGPRRLRYGPQRVSEFRAFLAVPFRARAAAHGVELVSFSSLVPCLSSS